MFIVRVIPLITMIILHYRPIITHSKVLPNKLNNKKQTKNQLIIIIIIIIKNPGQCNLL